MKSLLGLPYILEYVKLNDFSVIVEMDGGSIATMKSLLVLNYKPLKNMSDCFSRKKLKRSFYFLFYNAGKILYA